MTKEQVELILNTLQNWRNDPNIFNRKASSNHYIHYTSFAGFKAMLEPYAEKGELYLKIFPSQIQYLNDYQEYKAGVNVVKQEEAGGNNNIFAVCFCGKEDLLSQWKYYGKNSGISIEFDFNKHNPCRFKWWGNIAEITHNDNDGFLMTPYMVFYDKHEAEYKKLYENFKLSHAESLLKNIFIPFCKNKSFHEENERRLIFYPISDKGVCKTDIKYRVTDDKIIPQFECSVAYYDAKACNSVPIKNVMIGPGRNQILLFNAVINMLERNKSDLLFYDDDIIARIKESANVDNKVHPSKSLYIVKKGSNKFYITYKTESGITVQLSPTPFRP